MKLKVSDRKLNVTEKTFLCLEYPELENFITEHLGRQFDLPQTELCGNDVELTFIIKEEDEVSDYYMDKIQEWREGGNPNWITHDIMVLLKNMGVLEPGNYLVTVSW